MRFKSTILGNLAKEKLVPSRPAAHSLQRTWGVMKALHGWETIAIDGVATASTCVYTVTS